MSPGATIEVRHLVRRYRLPDGEELHAVRDVSVDFPAGSVTGLLGPSGSGKSTLLHLIGGIERPDSGSILVDGKLDLAGLTRRALTDYRRTIGFVFQRFNLLPSLTALDNVLAPLVPYRTTFDRRARARELLASVGLSGREDAIPSRLSGGQQQRVAIARALIGQPRIMLADEPTGNLDSRTGTEIIELLLQLRETQGSTIVLATHDLAIAGSCDSTCWLRDGRIDGDRVV
jgi:putative ABC transport system ATP-binding protein